MSLRLVALASGSKGNATLILSDNTAILVDVGISYTRLQRELKEFGLTPAMIDGVVITHEHSDHICGLKRLSEVVDVYAHPRTMGAIARKQGMPTRIKEIDAYELGFEIGDITVIPFRIPHDAEYPLAYSFECGGARCSVATDIGEPTVGVLRNIKDSSVVLLESNHDIDMLKLGNYPQVLKNRILSSKGHLSNVASARIVQLLCQDSEVKIIMLGHISEHNNTEDLAYNTVKKMLDSMDSDIELYVAHQGQRSEVIEI